MSVSFASMYLDHVFAWFPWISGEGVGSPGTGMKGDYKPICGYTELNPDFLQEQQMLSPPRGSPSLIFNGIFIYVFVCLYFNC